MANLKIALNPGIFRHAFVSSADESLVERRLPRTLLSLLDGIVLALSVQACMSAVPTLSSGGLTPSGRTDVALGASSTLPTTPSFVAAREEQQDAAQLVPHLSFRHGLHLLDDADWRVSPADLDLSLTLLPGYGVASARLALWQARDGTNRYALLAGVSLEGGVFGDQGRDLRPAFGGRIPVSLTTSLGSVLEAWVGAQAISIYVANAEQSSVFGGGAFVGLAAGLRNLHVLFELQGNLLSADWFSGPLDWHWTPSFSLRMRL